MIYGTPDFEELVLKMITGGENGKRHDLYKTTVECAKKMRVHVYGDRPDDILDRVRPREPDEIKNYRKENYEPTTKATASKALSVVSKIFNPNLSQIRWQEQSNNGKKLQDYALQNYPKHNSIINFLAQAGLKKMIADPNGVFAIKQRSIPATDLVTVEPEIKVYGSPNIWWYDRECFIIHIKEEEQSGQGKRMLHYFEYYDKTQIVEFTAEAINQKTVVVTEISAFNHNCKDIPVWFLTGETETQDNGEEYYISYFEPALPFWNKAITHESYLDAAFIMHLHPQKVVTAEECDFVHEDQRCQHGKILYPDGKYTTCPACKGSGKRIAIGPFGVHMVSKEKLDVGQQMNVPVQYVTVPTEPTEMLARRVDEQHKKGLHALNMDILDQVGENQSGIAKVIDRGELYDFLYKIADVVFGTHLTNFFYYFNQMMFGVQDSNPGRNLYSNLPEINKPTTFDLTTVAEKTATYKTAKDASMNPEYLRQKGIEIATKDFGTSPDTQRKIITVLELDPLPEVSAEDIELKLSIGTISKKDAVIHDNLSSFIDQAVTTDKTFYSKTKQEKQEIIAKLADKFIADNQIKLTLMEDDTEEADGGDRKQVA
jgi:hypothetical protein